MKIGGVVQTQASQADVWRLLADPQRVLEAIPGVTGVSSAGDGQWRATVSIPTALGDVQYDFQFEVVERRANEFLKLYARGISSQHEIEVVAEWLLATAGDETAVRWQAEVRLGGVLASVGQRAAIQMAAERVALWLEQLLTRPSWAA